MSGAIPMADETPDVTGLTPRETITARSYETILWLIKRREADNITSKELLGFIDMLLFVNGPFVSHDAFAFMSKIQKALSDKLASS